MSIKSIPVLLACGLLVCGLLCNVAQALELIEPLPHGKINWTRGLLIATGSDPQTEVTDASERRGTARKPTALQNLLDSFQYLKIDADKSIGDLFADHAAVLHKVQQMVAAAPVVEQAAGAQGPPLTTVQFALNGGFAQLVLPGTIKQVESVKTIKAGAEGDESEVDLPASSDEAGKREVYTGLVVDARGIGAQPALVPVILDENYQEVYSPAFISREYAVCKGVCGYARRIDGDITARVGPKPLVVKGLRAMGERPSIIVISAADASRLREVSAHLHFLRQCRVLILLD